jgi:hypothetical protein
MGLRERPRTRNAEEVEALYRVPPRRPGCEEGPATTARSIVRGMTLRQRIGGDLKSASPAV